MNILEILYRLKQTRRYAHAFGQDSAIALGSQFGVLSMHGELTGVLERGPNAKVTNLSPRKRFRLGLLSRRVVTNAGVAYMVDDFDNASGGADISNFNFHDSGTGNTAEAAADTALVTPTGVARVAGTRSQPAANQYRTAAQITYDNTYAVVEHGLFSASSVGTLWDRSVFAAINVVNLDSITFTYTLTCTAGG